MWTLESWRVQCGKTSLQCDGAAGSSLGHRLCPRAAYHDLLRYLGEDVQLQQQTCAEGSEPSRCQSQWEHHIPGKYTEKTALASLHWTAQGWVMRSGSQGTHEEQPPSYIISAPFFQTSFMVCPFFAAPSVPSLSTVSPSGTSVCWTSIPVHHQKITE